MYLEQGLAYISAQTKELRFLNIINESDMC